MHKDPRFHTAAERREIHEIELLHAVYNAVLVKDDNLCSMYLVEAQRRIRLLKTS